MFERYTEPARKAVFMARYEASQTGADYIEPIHLLLGLLREDAFLRGILSESQRERIREKAERIFPAGPSTSTSVDMPLSHSCKRALDHARDAADALHSPVIDSRHLLLGVLRTADEPLQALLAPHGVTEEIVRRRIDRPAPGPPRAPLPYVRRSALEQISEHAAEQRLARLPWTRKQALGHLIDWAAAHHEWLGRALVEPRVVAHAYPLEERVDAAHYAEMSWTDLVIAWLSLNDLVERVIQLLPEDRLAIPCRIGIEPEKPLEAVIGRYREYTSDIVAQICTLGDVIP